MILVTGAGGFLGQSVCRQLDRDGLRFIGADRCSPEPCDVTDREAVERLFQTHPIDTVIHLAALLPSACRRNPAEATRINVVGSAHVLEAAAARGVQRFVFASSISVYGSGETGADLYGAGKRYMEAYGEALARARDFAFTALRIATVVGPGARHTASPWRSELFEKLGSGARQRVTIPFGADAVLSLVHVEDAAGMLIRLAIRRDAPSPVYDSPSENWRMRDLKEMVETLHPNVTLELDDTGRQAAPPLADGSRFVRDFAWCAAPLANRFAACLLE